MHWENVAIEIIQLKYRAPAARCEIDLTTAVFWPYLNPIPSCGADLI